MSAQTASPYDTGADKGSISVAAEGGSPVTKNVMQPSAKNQTHESAMEEMILVAFMVFVCIIWVSPIFFRGICKWTTDNKVSPTASRVSAQDPSATPIGASLALGGSGTNTNEQGFSPFMEWPASNKAYQCKCEKSSSTRKSNGGSCCTDDSSTGEAVEIEGETNY